MDSVSMVVVVFELPEGAHAAMGHEENIQVGEVAIGAIHAVGVEASEMARLVERIRGSDVRDATRSILRRLGENGERAIRRERDFDFIWVDAQLKHGPAKVLYVLPIDSAPRMN